MYETPQRIPYEIVQDDGQAHDETRDMNIEEFGDVLDPKSYGRVRNAPALDPDHDGDPA